MNKIKREIKTFQKMVEIYCKSQHKSKSEICDECNSLEKYAIKKLNKCCFKEDKPACKNCPVHCFKPEYKAKTKEIMRFSGPKMVFKHPILTFWHLQQGKKVPAKKSKND